MADTGLSRGQLTFMSLLLLAGFGLLGWAAYRVWSPPAPAGPDLAQLAEEDLKRRGFQALSAELDKLINDPTFTPAATQAMPLLNQQAPDFALPSVEGSEWKLSTRKPGPLLLVFYYGYHCDHGVIQLFGLHKDIDKFRELGVEVIAISADSPKLTRERYQQYGAFAFPVLSDEDNKVAHLYGAYKPGTKGEEGQLSHATFVISPQGKIVWLNGGEEPFTDNRTLLVELSKVR